MRNIVTGGGANIFSNKTFTGEFKVGANGTPLHEMRHFSTSISGPLNPNQSTTTNIAISPAFSGVPNIQIIATSDTGANPNNDAALTVIVNGAITTTNVPIKVTNENTAATTGSLRVNYILYR